jgi:hypothetical protein
LQVKLGEVALMEEIDTSNVTLVGIDSKFLTSGVLVEISAFDGCKTSVDVVALVVFGYSCTNENFLIAFYRTGFPCPANVRTTAFMFLARMAAPLSLRWTSTVNSSCFAIPLFMNMVVLSMYV